MNSPFLKIAADDTPLSPEALTAKINSSDEEDSSLHVSRKRAHSHRYLRRLMRQHIRKYHAHE